ncbi:peptidylprolyl isomerase [Leucobacter zeae]|nr:peptidylprolyl isomerase [Leucobacter zeae]
MLRRLVPATAAAALLLTGLTACSAQSASADCTASLQAGVLSDSVTVLGDAGAVPQVSVPEDIAKISATQRTVVTEASDRERVAGEGSIVSATLTVVDSGTGKQIYTSPSLQDPAQDVEFLMVAKDAANPLSEAVRCTAPGERVVLAIAPEDGAQLAMQLGADPADPLVVVIDVAAVAPTHAEGRTRGLPSGYPAVVTDDTGRPGVVLPPRDPRAGTSSASRIVGDGAEVEAGDNVIAQVLSVGWDGSEKRNTWAAGALSGENILGNEDQVAQSGNTFRAELTGKTVGSQVVVVENEKGAEPQVVVVDILAVG